MAIRRLVFLAGVLGLGLLGGCKKDLEGLGIQLSIEKKTLSNGLKIILVEDPSVPIISYQTWFKSGSVDEKPGSTGISHLFEHLMFKGTQKYGPQKFYQELESQGAEVNAFTTRDFTVYYENFSPSLLEKVIELESDRMSHLQLTQNILDTERQVVLEERRQRTENSPEGKMQEALWQLAYQKHPYQWPVIGYASDLLSLRLETLHEHYQTYYQPSNATLIITGAFQPSQTFELIQKYYGSIPSTVRPARNAPPEPEQREERRLILRGNVHSVRLAQAFHIPAASEEDSYALDVLANILFEGESSRGHQKLVEEKKFALAVSGSAHTPMYPGLFLVSVSLRSGIDPDSVEKELEKLFNQIQHQKPSTEEINRAVRQLTLQLTNSVRSSHGLGQLIGTLDLIFGDPTRFSNALQKYFSVTSDVVQKVSKHYLTPNNRSVVTLLPSPPQGKTP